MPTRNGINTLLHLVPKIWTWGLSVGATTVEQVEAIKQVRTLTRASGEAPDKPRRPRVKWEELETVMKSMNTVVADLLEVI